VADEKPRRNRTDDKPEHDEQNAELNRFERLPTSWLEFLERFSYQLTVEGSGNFQTIL
jgi:hypothetical protein